MFARRLLLAGLFLVATHTPVLAQAFSETGLQALQTAMDERVEAGRRTGYAVILIRGDEREVLTSGTTTLGGDSPMLATTPMRMASMTKPVTAAATMMLVERGLIGLDDPVGEYIPSFANMRVATAFEANENGVFPTEPATAPVTIRHLLTHTSGIGYIFDAQTDLGRLMIERTLYQGDGDLAAKMDELAQFPLYFQPGERWLYSYSNDVLGRVVEVASGMPFEDFLETEIFAPLGMDDTTFFVTDEELEQIAGVYTHIEGGQLVDPYSEENPEYRPSWASGGGGLASTGEDYARFAMMLANGGTLDGVTLMQPETVAAMHTPQVELDQLPESMAGLTYGFGVGIVLPATEERPAMGIPGDYGWGGFFDTDFFVSPSTGLVAIMMTQVIPGQHMPEGRTASWWRAAAYGTLPQ